jgi:hypothetical protein
LSLLAAKAEESLQGRIRRSLPDGDISDRINEILDEVMNEHGKLDSQDQFNPGVPLANYGHVQANLLETSGHENLEAPVNTRSENEFSFSRPAPQRDSNWISSLTSSYENCF